MPDKNTKPICETCGSDDVLIDAYASWDPTTGRFDVDSTFDNAFCRKCEGECHVNWVTVPECHNCFQTHASLHDFDVCIPAALIAVSVFDRESLTEDEAHAILNKVSADAVWNDIAPIIDRLEAGYYDYEQEEK